MTELFNIILALTNQIDVKISVFSQNLKSGILFVYFECRE